MCTIQIEKSKSIVLHPHFTSTHTSCEDALKEKKISEQTTGQALFWTYFCIRICVEANDLATSKQGLVYITI